MKLYYRILFTALLLLLIATVAGLVATNRPIGEPRRGSAYRDVPAVRLARATQDQFDVARKLAARAFTREEQWTAREALRIADGEVDLAFATALQEATEHPLQLSPDARAIADRLKASQARLDADRAESERLKKALAAAKESAKDALQQQLDVLDAQVDLDQDEVDDARQDLIRAGGDLKGVIERMKKRYEAREQAGGGLQSLVPSTPQASVEDTDARNLIALGRAWYSLHGKLGDVRRAEQAALAQSEELGKTHDATDREADKPGDVARLSSLKDRAARRKALEVLDRRIEDETQLAEAYRRWGALVEERQRLCVRKLLSGLLVIVVIALLTTAIDLWASRSFARMAADRRQMHTLHSVAGFAIRGAGVVLILLVVFGPPTQFAAVLALAGAGLTVALKDLIVALIGWVVLMGRNGIRIGDWVEINGVSGEVLEIGPMRTILLETGDWSDAGHPTGRKVAFMNGFAVEGNYFNFSTSGQWMWDEIQLAVPPSADPFTTADSVRQSVAAETAENAKRAIEEWRKAAPGVATEAFTAEPVTSVRPSGSGATVVVRYVTRANERHEVRSRLYKAMIDLQRGNGKAGEASRS